MPSKQMKLKEYVDFNSLEAWELVCDKNDTRVEMSGSSRDPPFNVL